MSPRDSLAPTAASPWQQPVDLPLSGWAALWRGMRGACPRCGQARLFAGFLKPVPFCSACGHDWTRQRADDFPAYVSILLTGHLITPLILILVRDHDLPMLQLFALILPLTLALMLGFLRPAKGAIIAVQWWFGMHGFTRERRERV